MIRRARRLGPGGVVAPAEAMADPGSHRALRGLRVMHVSGGDCACVTGVISGAGTVVLCGARRALGAQQCALDLTTARTSPARSGCPDTMR